MRMDQIHPKASPGEDVEFRKGCPICEHSDAELERLLQQFAEWLYSIMAADEKKKRAAEQSEHC